jgi:hypothetical protein
MHKSFFLTFLVILFLLAVFIVCAIGMDYCLDLIGPDPECTDLQLAYFGTGLIPIFLIGSGSALLSILFSPLIDRLSVWITGKLKIFRSDCVARK